MGCGGSKMDVASNNTVTKRQQHTKRSSEASSSNVGAEAASTSAVPSDAAGNNPAVPADVKEDTTVNTAGEEEGSLLEHSPDRYFSTRKDDDSLDAAAVEGYFSPRHGEIAVEKALREAAAEEGAGASRMDGDQTDKQIGELSVEMKEPILVEERKLEVTIIEKKHIGISETLDASSNQ